MFQITMNSIKVILDVIAFKGLKTKALNEIKLKLFKTLRHLKMKDTLTSQKFINKTALQLKMLK